MRVVYAKVGLVRRSWPIGLIVAVMLVPASIDAQSLAVGDLSDPVVSKADPTQRYVIYLPTGFDRSRPTPILYVMDYRGRGRVAAEVYREAAERFGWILVSSYDTASDQSMLPNQMAMQAMWTDSHHWFTVDPARVYITGLSGTARAATLFAEHHSGAFTGVIGAAAGFDPSVPPTAQTSFLYFGTTGNVDYNYWEMRLLEGRLNSLGLPYRIEYFDGPHQWMPPDLAMRAVAWMELRAMHAGTRPVSADFVADQWREDLIHIDEAEEMGLVLQASRDLLSIARDYSGLRPAADLATVRDRARGLAESAVARAQTRALQEEAERHARLVVVAVETLRTAYPSGEAEPPRPVADTLRALDASRLLATAAGADPEAAQAARRGLAELSVQTGFYLPTDAIARRDFDQAWYYLSIAEALDPADPYAWYLRASVCGHQRQPDRALELLVRAVDLGYQNLVELESDPAFVRIRDRPEFVAIVERVRQVSGRASGQGR